MNGIATDRQCPEDKALTVREAFALESRHLLALPDNPYATDEQVAVKIGKTPYARFDLNDYSVPHDYVQRNLTVSANLQHVRILDAQAVLATHSRSFDKGVQIEIPQHIEKLVEYKHQASQHRGTDRLAQAVPESRELLRQAAERGEPLERITKELLRFLDRYGVAELTVGVQEALARGVPHPNAVRLTLERRREARNEPPPIEMALPDYLKGRDNPVKPHDLTSYDVLTEVVDDAD